MKELSKTGQERYNKGKCPLTGDKEKCSSCVYDKERVGVTAFNS